jgi:hypothetical protein
MPYPSDVLLPINSKYYGFVDTKTPYNPHWDITWSFSYALTGTNQHAFCTFLTTTSSLTSAIPGQYLGYLGNSKYLLDEYGNIILNETGDRILFNDSSNLSSYDTTGILAIAFDSTGLFALSSTDNSGVGINQLKKNSLIIRDSNNTVIYNEALSSLDSTFFLSSSTKEYKTLRFRFSNGGKRLYLDKRENSQYTNLLNLPISYDMDNYDNLYPGFTFCSPISTNIQGSSTIFLKNFHTQGCLDLPTYETVACNPILDIITEYKTLSGIL